MVDRFPGMLNLQRKAFINTLLRTDPPPWVCNKLQAKAEWERQDSQITLLVVQKKSTALAWSIAHQ